VRSYGTPIDSLSNTPAKRQTAMTSPQRRQFLKTAGTAAMLGPAGLIMQQRAGAADSSGSPVDGFPDISRGQVVRTSGKLVDAAAFEENSRRIPVAGHSQVLVCGGGPAGIAAALAAARSGAKTQLLELAGCLGGVWTAGMLTKILDTGGKSGIMKEVLTALAAQGSDVAKDSGGTVYDPELAKVVLEEMCVDAGVEICLHTMVVGAVTNDKNQLVAVITESKSGRQVWTADRFIDCTGDGDLAAQAGCQFDLGFGDDCVCQPMSMMALITGPEPEDVQEFIRETGASAKPRFLKFMRDAGIDPSYRAPTLRHLHSGIYSIMTNHEYGVSAFDAAAITKATIEYMSAQIEAGAEVMKIFDSWAGSLSGEAFQKYALEPAREITQELKKRHPGIPIIGFPREAGDQYIGFHKATGVDCVALDNSVSAEWAAANVQVDGCVQGNLASRHMVTGGQDLIDETRTIVKAFSKGPHIFNLGHGITPDANPDNVQLMIDTVRDAG